METHAQRLEFMASVERRLTAGVDVAGQDKSEYQQLKIAQDTYDGAVDLAMGLPARAVHFML